MKIQEIIQIIEAYAPRELQADFDNSGLICGDVEQEVTSILLCIDVTEDVVREAIQKGHNLIISHHPLIFKGLKQITPSTYVERSIILAVKNEIAIYAAHTNMDVIAQGVSGRMADKLCLTDQEILQQEGETPYPYGYGIIGTLDSPVDPIFFLQHVKETFHCKGIRYTNPSKRQIQRVAVCGGAGASFLPTAILKKADLYITGDLKYHDFFLTENRIILADIGHYESEQFTKDIFYELVTKKMPKFAVQFYDINTNPINYL